MTNIFDVFFGLRMQVCLCCEQKGNDGVNNKNGIYLCQKCWLNHDKVNAAYIEGAMQ